MPSPFPGMDPYLEQPERWGGVHARLIAIIGEMLTGQVAPRYFVDSEDHVYIIPADDPARSLVRPDIYLAEATPAAPLQRSRGHISTPMLIDLPETAAVRYPYLEVRDTANREVVATLELLSPINKVSGSVGLRDFLRKRSQIMRSTAHWIEIDLLRSGVRPMAIGGQAAYYAALHRAGEAETLSVWFATPREELPTIAVPLRAPLPDVALDLQDAVDTLYRRYRYDAVIDYSGGLSPPLDPADTMWSQERIAAWREGRSAGA